MSSDLHLRGTVDQKGLSLDLQGLAPEQVTQLELTVQKGCGLEALLDFPNLQRLWVRGEKVNLAALPALQKLSALGVSVDGKTDFSAAAGLSVEQLTVYAPSYNDTLPALLSESLTKLQLSNMRGLSDLSFLQKAPLLQTLYLQDLPSAEVLSMLPASLRALKLYGLHKLSDLDGLAASGVEYFSGSLIADKISGSRLAEVLMKMPKLKKACLVLIDRSGSRRYAVLKNALMKQGCGDLLTENIEELNRLFF